MLDALGFSWEVPAAPRGRARSKTTTAVPVAAAGGGVSGAMTDRANDNAAGGAPGPRTVAVSDNVVTKRRYTRKTKPDGTHSPSDMQGPQQPNDQMTHLPAEPTPFDALPLAEDIGNDEDADEEMLKLLDPEIQKEVRLMRFFPVLLLGLLVTLGAERTVQGWYCGVQGIERGELPSANAHMYVPSNPQRLCFSPVYVVSLWSALCPNSVHRSSSGREKSSRSFSARSSASWALHYPVVTTPQLLSAAQ
jgi:hypothetical protein